MCWSSGLLPRVGFFSPRHEFFASKPSLEVQVPQPSPNQPPAHIDIISQNAPGPSPKHLINISPPRVRNVILDEKDDPPRPIPFPRLLMIFAHAVSESKLSPHCLPAGIRSTSLLETPPLRTTCSDRPPPTAPLRAPNKELDLLSTKPRKAARKIPLAAAFTHTSLRPSLGLPPTSRSSPSSLTFSKLFSHLLISQL